MSFAASNQLEERLHEAIPGGAHGPERGCDQFPEELAPVLVRGRGARVWDVDGNEFVEYGAVGTLGHAHEPVLRAVRLALADGISFTRPTELELLAAEELLAVVPGAELVSFAPDALGSAVRLARAATGRDLIAVSDQPLAPTSDWQVGTTAMHAGVPEATRGLAATFGFNDLASLDALLTRRDGQVAAVVLAPATTSAEPAPGFLEGVRELCDRHGALLVFDETGTALRWGFPGFPTGVVPDLAAWGASLANGFPLSALTGRRPVMELAGLRTEARRVLLPGGADVASLAALRAVLRAHAEGDPIATLRERGRALADGFAEAAREIGVAEHLALVGPPAALAFATADIDGRPSVELRTLLLQQLLAGGVLGREFVISAAHTEADIDHTLEAARSAMLTYRKALEAGSASAFLTGRPVAPPLRPFAHPRRRL